LTRYDINDKCSHHQNQVEDVSLVLNGQQASNIKDKHSMYEKLIRQYKQYIQVIASKYKWFLDQEDLIQEGYLGLIEAAKRFNVSKKVTFKTFATQYIKKHMLRAIENTSSLVRVPVYIQQLNRDIKKLKHVNPEISVEAIADKLSVTVNQVGYALQVQKQVLLDFEVVSNTHDPSTLEKINIKEKEIQAIIDQMPITWKMICNERYQKKQKMTYQKLSEILHISIRKVKEEEHEMKVWIQHMYDKLLQDLES